MAVDYRGHVALELIAVTFCLSRVYGCRASDMDGPGRFVGSPLHWISAGIGLVTLAEQQLVFQRNWESDLCMGTSDGELADPTRAGP
jgi:hypothetical protein